MKSKMSDKKIQQNGIRLPCRMPCVPRQKCIKLAEIISSALLKKNGWVKGFLDKLFKLFLRHHIHTGKQEQLDVSYGPKQFQLFVILSILICHFNILLKNSKDGQIETILLQAFFESISC